VFIVFTDNFLTTHGGEAEQVQTPHIDDSKENKKRTRTRRQEGTGK
jgi:hypothetical protein